MVRIVVPVAIFIMVFSFIFTIPVVSAFAAVATVKGALKAL